MTLSGTQYLCVAGETFDSVALVVYRNEKYAAELLNANPTLSMVPIFAGGELLDLPVIEMTSETSQDTYMPNKAPWKE